MSSVSSTSSLICFSMDSSRGSFSSSTSMSCIPSSAEGTTAFDSSSTDCCKYMETDSYIASSFTVLIVGSATTFGLDSLASSCSIARDSDSAMISIFFSSFSSSCSFTLSLCSGSAFSSTTGSFSSKVDSFCCPVCSFRKSSRVIAR